jgi:hypothetical protein
MSIGEGERFAVRAERHVAGRVTFYGENILPGPGVPHHRPTVTGGGDPLAVRAERHGVPPLECQDFLAGRGVPHLHSLGIGRRSRAGTDPRSKLMRPGRWTPVRVKVRTDGGDPLAIGAEHHASNTAVQITRVPLEG